MRAFARVAIFKTGRGKAQNLTKKRGRPTAKLKMSRDFAALLWVACYHLKMCACATSTIWVPVLMPERGGEAIFHPHITSRDRGHNRSWLLTLVTFQHNDDFIVDVTCSAIAEALLLLVIALKCSVFLSCNLRRFVFPIIEILAVATTSLIHNFWQLRTFDPIFVGKRLDAISAWGNNPKINEAIKFFGGWILRFALLPVQNISNVVIDKSRRVSMISIL